MARRIPRLWNPALVLLLVARAVSASAEETVTYAYDDAGRLTNAAYSGGANITYAYDANGNLVMRTVTAAGGTTYTLIYRAGTGGWIDGVATQVVAEGQSGTPVTAVVENASAVFHGWSDDSEANPRTDAEVMADLTVIASFLSQGGRTWIGTPRAASPRNPAKTGPTWMRARFPAREPPTCTKTSPIPIRATRTTCSACCPFPTARR